jgi:GH15 family glucan-1,4-alpha-glucosidase
VLYMKKGGDEQGKSRLRSAQGAVAGSVASMLRNQHPTGAFVASPDFSQYAYCWLRDGSFTAYALDRAGRTEASERFHDWCAAAVNRIEPTIATAVARHLAGRPVDPTQMPPARFGLDGYKSNDDWPNFQVDGYGTWLWSLDQHLRAAGEATLPSRLAPAVESTARYLLELGTSPCFDVWEEAGGSVHTVTLGSVSAGLDAAGRMLNDSRLGEQAGSLRSAITEQAARFGRFFKSDHDDRIDGSLLWLCEPLRVVAPGQQALTETVRRVVEELDFEGGVRRYATDTYYGGGAWPVLTASLGLYYAATGDLEAAQRRRDWVAAHIDDKGRLAEQFGGERRDPEHYFDWCQRWGPPAADLVWSHAMYVLLETELEAAALPPHAATLTGSSAPDHQ